jgi:hypothetical protein
MTVTSKAAAGFGASWIAWITRAVARNNTATISTGMTVQATSIWVLPYTWAGSRPISPAFPRNFTTEYASKVKTTTNMTPVTESTKTDNPKIVFAGVEAGEKIFVELNREAAGSAAARAMELARNVIISSARRMIEVCSNRIRLSLIFHSLLAEPPSKRNEIQYSRKILCPRIIEAHPTGAYRAALCLSPLTVMQECRHPG